MALEDIADKVIDTDVFIVGGGMAGCGAAAKAKEYGLDVTIAEKAHTYRSGSAAAGLDHQNELQMFPVTDFKDDRITLLDYLRSMENRNMVVQGFGRWEGDPNRMAQNIIENRSLWVLEELEKLGISSKWDDGQYYFTPAAWWDGAMVVLRVHWNRIKPKLHEACIKRGVNILQRTMVVDLLTNNGRVVGATAVNTRTGEFIVIKAKAVGLAAGGLWRIYSPETPVSWKYKLRYHFFPGAGSGDQLAMAYRAGGELSNMDISGWAFRIRDDSTISFGNFTWNDGLTAKYFTWTGEEIGYNSAPKYRELEDKGLTPVYNSLEHLPDDFHKRIEVAYVDERLVSFKIAEDRGFNPRTHRYEMMDNRPHYLHHARVATEGDLRARMVKGLHAMGGTGGGLTAGERIHLTASEAPEPDIDEAQVVSQKQVALAPLNIKDGTEPMELECAIRYVCDRYIGQFKSEGKIREGVRRLGSLKREFLGKLMAKDPHYLMRALECRNLIEMAEVHMNAVMERKESRGNHIRLDYPDRDKSLDYMITYQHLEKGRHVLERRKVPQLTPENARKFAEMK
jgi:succinate dehydrogenase/fumarate reductase flavoprotein subunit